MTRAIWLLCFLVLVEVWPTECRRNGTRSQSKQSSRLGKNRIIGGSPHDMPNWIGSAWAQKTSEFAPKADQTFHGLCINIGPRLVLAQYDAVGFLEERPMPQPDHNDTNQRSDYISPTPWKIHNIDGVPGHGLKDSIYRPAHQAPWRFTIYRRRDRQYTKPPLFKPPFPIYETNKTNLGSNCIMSGYSRTINGSNHDHERVFASLPVRLTKDARNNSTNDPIYELTTRGGLAKVCAGFSDVGNPIICGANHGERKLTYIVIYKEGDDRKCNFEFSAYHVAHLVDSIQTAIKEDKGNGVYDKQPSGDAW